MAMDKDTGEQVIKWMATSKYCSASMTLLEVVLGRRPVEGFSPEDLPRSFPQFRNCLDLVRAVPGIHGQLDKLRGCRGWAGLLDQWQELAFIADRDLAQGRSKDLSRRLTGNFIDAYPELAKGSRDQSRVFITYLPDEPDGIEDSPVSRLERSLRQSFGNQLLDGNQAVLLFCNTEKHPVSSTGKVEERHVRISNRLVFSVISSPTYPLEATINGRTIRITDAYTASISDARMPRPAIDKGPRAA